MILTDEQRRPVFQAARELGVKFNEQSKVDRLDRGIAEMMALLGERGAEKPSGAQEIGAGRTSGLASATAFYTAIRSGKLLGDTLSPSEVSGMEAILAACAGAKWPIAYTAYALATAYLETAHTMQPIKEYGGPSYFRKMYDIQGSRPAKARELGNLSPGDGVKFCGRGYVQLTGRTNYAKAGAFLGTDLVNNPDDAMKPDIAAAIMVRGMENGWFTGKSMKSYLPASSPASVPEFKEARRIINGQDRAADVASYAASFQQALKAGGWQ